MTLTGWSLPQSATGRSALLPAPPWHYSGEVIAVDFSADPARAAELVPPERAGAAAEIIPIAVSSLISEFLLIAPIPSAATTAVPSAHQNSDSRAPPVSR